MATERFDIEVRDVVAKSIKTELAAIGAQARTSHGLVQQLNRELAAGTRAAAQTAQTAASQAASAAGNSAAAQARATAESARAAAQAARTETAIRRANVAYLQEEAALNRAIVAEQKAIASKQRLAAAAEQAAQASANAARQISISESRAVPAAANSWIGGQAGDRAAASRQTDIMRGGGASVATPAVEGNTAALDRNATAANLASSAQAKFDANTKRVASSSQLASQHAMNLGFQLNDVFVSLASGQSIMMVAVQQGAQIAQINQQTGLSWRQMGKEALIMTRILKTTTEAQAAAELSAATLAARNLQNSAAMASAAVVAADTELALATAQQRAAVTASEQAAANSRLSAAHQLAATAAAEQTVAENALATAQGRQASASAAASRSTVTSLGSVGRVAVPVAAGLALLSVGIAGLNREANNTSGLKKYSEEMGYTAKEVARLNGVTVSFGDTAKAVFQVSLKRILGAFGVDVDSMANAWNRAMDWMANAARNSMAGAYAVVAGTVSAIAKLVKGEMQSPADLKASYVDAYGDAQEFMSDVVKQARANAREGQDALAKELWNEPSAKRDRKGPTGFDRAKELAQVNRELDSQIGLLQYYGQELERQTQLEQIARRFREEGVPLTAAENAALMTKITTLQQGVVIQQAMTAAEEAANGPRRAYEASETALNRLLEQGAINQAEHTRQMNLAARAFEDATEPLAAMNRELEKQAGLVSHYGKSRDLKEYIQQLKDAAEAQGKSIYEQTPAGAANDNEIVVNGSSKYNADAQRMIDEWKRQREVDEMTSAFQRIDPMENQSVGSNEWILDNHRRMYEDIQRFRDEDVRNEEEAARRKKNLDRAVTAARLDSASQMFGQLATLQNSSIREVAAIGKAAAIAQATIDGISAVQAALKGPPGPPWSYAIAGTTAVMTAANVAKIAGIGFQRGGYTGDGDPGDVAGPAHRQEFVFDQAATRRIGVPALEALRSGRTFGPGQNTPAGGSGATSLSIGQINVTVTGQNNDPEAAGRAAEQGVMRAVKKLTRDEIRNQQRDGGLLDSRVMTG